MSNSASKLRFLLVQLVLCAAVILIIDITCYLYLGETFTRHFGGYRRNFQESLLSYSSIGGRAGYPRNYFIPHPDRGFDIGPNRHGTHVITDEAFSYPVWSNSFGCFDKEWDVVPSGYFYFAGDSFTWGYAPYETKFATVFERLTGVSSLKCGVTHTGQAHQFSKFLDITAKVGAFPRKVIVGFVPNDPANDYAHPHTTVIDGWQVDKVYLDSKYNLVTVDDAWISEQIKEKQVRFAKQRGKERNNRAFINFIKNYSITAQLANRSYHYLINWLTNSNMGVYAVAELGTKGGHLAYDHFAFAEHNKNIVREWQAHSINNHYKLVFVLIPKISYSSEPDFYNELKRFMDISGILYIDLGDEFIRRHLNPGKIYWPNDGHLSPSGNKIAGEILSEKLLD